MSKFKVGDIVRVVKPFRGGLLFRKGDFATVIRWEFFLGDLYLDVEVGGVAINGCRASRFALVEDKPTYPNPPHKHAELIKAWADGAEIELLQLSFWRSIECPMWRKSEEYRIKPTKSAKDIKIEELEQKARELADEINRLKCNR